MKPQSSRPDRPSPLPSRRDLLRVALVVATAAALPVSSAAEGGARPGGVRVEQPWSRATAPGMTVGVAYLSLANRGRVADALVAASSPVAARVEIHSSRMDGGMMQMRQLQRVELPAGQVVRFEPGGLHLMLVGLKRPLVAGESVPLLLRFAVAGEQRVALRVEALDYEPRAARAIAR